MNKLKINLYENAIFIFIIIIFLILFSGHTLQTIYSIPQYLVVASSVFVIPIIYAYLRNKLNTFLLSYLIFIIMMGSTFIATGGIGLNYYLNLFLIITFAFGVTVVYEFNDFVNLFLKVMVIVSIVSIIGHFLVQTNLFFDSLPLLVNKNGVYYKTIFIFSYITTLPERNIGIFWEPGIFATFIVYALMFEVIFKKENLSKFRVLLFSITILTTQSTAGYLLWFLCLIILILNRTSYKNKKENKDQKKISSYLKLLFFSGTILILFNLDSIIMNTSLINNQYIEKLLVEELIESTRFNAISHNLSVYSENPVFGSGIVTVSNQLKNYADTSTTTYFISIFGVMGSMYTIYFIHGILKINSIDIYSKISIVFIILSIINKEPHGGIVFTWCILFYLLKETTIKENK